MVARCEHRRSPARRPPSSLQIAPFAWGDPFGIPPSSAAAWGAVTPSPFSIGFSAPPPPFVHGVPSWGHGPRQRSTATVHGHGPRPRPRPRSTATVHLRMGRGAWGDPFVLDFPLRRRMRCPIWSHLRVVLAAISSSIRAWGSRYGVAFSEYFVAPPPFLHNKVFKQRPGPYV